MTFHHKAANRAAALGKNSTELKKAAQKHASAAWIFLITAGAVWYFWGWQLAVIPAIICFFTAFQSISSNMIAERIEKIELPGNYDHNETINDFMSIIQEYGKVLEESSPAPGCAADVSKLPYPKEVIKSALIKGLKVTDDPTLQKHLKVAYINLSRWQEGVGEKDQGLDLSNIDQNQSAEKIAHAMVSKSPQGINWPSIILNDQRELWAELKKYGFSNNKL